MDADPRIKQIMDLITELVAEAYARGESDALERIMAAARSPGPRRDGSLIREPDDAEPAVDRGRKRAPRGLVAILVDRELREAAPNGLTPAAIRERARDDYEGMLAEATIRQHLRRGGLEGRYREDRGQWYLVEAPQAEPPLPAEAAAAAPEDRSFDPLAA
jgi:hypothetical protein